MSFFDDVPVPDRPRQPENVPPAWSGPPPDELPDVVSVGRFLKRSGQMVMAVKSIEVFSTGCWINLVWSVRRAKETDREWSLLTGRSFDHPHRTNAYPDDGGLRIGVAFADGRKTTTTHLHPGMFDGTEPVAGPVLLRSGGGGGSSSDSHAVSNSTLWLWPLPAEGDIRVVAQWDDLGMAEQSVVIEGGLLAEAARKVQNYWAT
ncbi:hypothetical protein [Arthrobacter sp. CJ23]|uniref:hypothetical protein n=1 Tax=Arthrobacter sp. CJ23 TaxID=2972479 RepID=UPI00215D5AF8|nr:hypothetical protein [Arthrobacter sp. CJ23]UVJ39448.1 hypothetical protein NVV90_19995 [Arthrobacter sp. CJ23]